MSRLLFWEHFDKVFFPLSLYLVYINTNVGYWWSNYSISFFYIYIENIMNFYGTNIKINGASQFAIVSLYICEIYIIIWVSGIR